MCPGAKGSEAYFCSMRMKRANKGRETEREIIVMGADHERVLPLSRPRRRAKTADKSAAAPGKSIRWILDFQWELSTSGIFKLLRR